MNTYEKVDNASTEAIIIPNVIILNVPHPLGSLLALELNKRIITLLAQDIR
jgi:hypothetical protein